MSSTNNQTMNTLQVTAKTVYPPTTGGDHRMHGLVIDFPSLGDTVVRFCQGGFVTNHNSLKIQKWLQIADDYYEYRPTNPFHDVPSVLQLIFSSPGYFSQKWLEFDFPNKLNALIQWADVIIVEHPFQIPPIADCTDETPIIYSSHNVESNRLQSKSRVLKNQYNTYIDSVEEVAVNESAAIICTSSNDKEEFERKFDDVPHTIVAPNGVYNSQIRDSKSCNGDKIQEQVGITPDSLVGIFVGSDYGPNVEAVKDIIKLTNEINDVRKFDVIIVGEVCNAIDDWPKNVHPTGFVQTIEPYYNAADIALNPISSGGGSNIKLIEYFGKGLPVITTPFGARGFDIEDGDTAFISELDQFPETILNTDDQTLTKVGDNAIELASKKYIWENISSDIHNEIMNVVDDFDA